jgi:hypothetical protein
LTYFDQLSPDQLRDFQKKSQAVIKKRHLQKCIEAHTLYSKSHNILEVCEKLGVKRRQAFRLVAEGKKYV